MKKNVILDKSETAVFELTKEYCTSDEWSPVLEQSRTLSVVKSLYDKDMYYSSAKGFLTKFFKNNEKVKFPFSGQYIFSGLLQELEDKSPSFINEFLSERSYYAQQMSSKLFKDIFKEHSDIISLSNKMKYLSREKDFIDYMDFSSHSVEEFKSCLFKEIMSNYPEIYVYGSVLKDLTINAIETLTAEERLEMATSKGINSHLGIHETRYEHFFLNNGSFNLPLLTKEMLEEKFKTKNSLFMTNASYLPILKQMINGEIKTEKKTLLLSNAIKTSSLSNEEILKLRNNNYIFYPLNKNQVDVYGRNRYISDVLQASIFDHSFVEEKFYAHLFKHIKNLLSFEELILLLKEEEYFGCNRILRVAGLYPEALFNGKGEIDFSATNELYELNEAH